MKSEKKELDESNKELIDEINAKEKECLYAIKKNSNHRKKKTRISLN